MSKENAQVYSEGEAARRYKSTSRTSSIPFRIISVTRDPRDCKNTRDSAAQSLTAGRIPDQSLGIYDSGAPEAHPNGAAANSEPYKRRTTYSVKHIFVLYRFPRNHQPTGFSAVETRMEQRVKAGGLFARSAGAGAAGFFV
jgi:hypothetical protein